MAGCARGTGAGLIHLHQAPSARAYICVIRGRWWWWWSGIGRGGGERGGEAGDWMPLRGSSTKRIWGELCSNEKGN